MTGTVERGILTIPLSGYVDSSNAAEMEAELMALRADHPHEGMELDCRELKYISSAGLRVVLRLRKLESRLRLTNVSADVYSVLYMTGFTELMPVEKVYRSLSLEGCEIIGRGSNGTVYRIDRDTVVKVYQGADCLPDVQRERELARKAFVLGIPTAIPYDVVRVGNSYGSVFELLDTRSFSKLITAYPERLDRYVELYVDLMEKLHTTHVRPGELPDRRELTLGRVAFLRDYLPGEQGEKLMKLVEGIPRWDTLLHGDLHTNNMVMQGDELLLLDMETLCMGHPIFELGSMYLGFVAFGELDHQATQVFLKLPYETAGRFWSKVLARYLNTEDPGRLKSVEEKAMVLGYTRLMRRTIRRGGLNSEQGRRAVSLCRERLSQLLAQVDTLTF